MEYWQSFEALFESMNKCRRGKMWKASVARFILHGIEEVIKLVDELKNGTYKPRKPNLFKLTYPKPRDCSSIHIRDRIIQRSVNDNEVYPAMVKGFVWGNIACQKGKGTSAGMDLLDQYLHKYFINNKTNKGYVLQVDIHGYYKHIRHDDALDCLRKNLRSYLMNSIKEWWKIQHPGEVGFEPGDQLTQIIGISLLSHMDHAVKEIMQAKYYSRYMDDFYIISNNKEFLLLCQELIFAELNALHLEVNPKKTRIYSLDEGIKFLGFTFKLTDTGKVIRLIDPQNVKHEKKKLYKMAQKVKKGEMTKHKFHQCFNSWLAHADQGNTYNVQTRMKQYVKELMEGL